MNRHRRELRPNAPSRLATVAIVMALVVGACGGDSSSATDEVAEADADPLTVTITDRGLDAEGMLAGNGGEMILVNESGNAADAQLVSIGDTGLDQVVDDIALVAQGEPIPAYVESAAGVGPQPPGGTATSRLTLPEGRYAVFTNLPQMTTPPEFFSEVEVTAAGPGRPETDGWIVASDYNFNLNLAAGEQTIAFSNRGPGQYHHMTLRAFPPSLNESEARRAMEVVLATPQGEAPPQGTPVPVDVMRSAVFAPGDSGTIDLDLTPGRQYFIGCFLTDRDGGEPHATSHDMWDVFSV